jgi:pimeloyl-ACP methyl ester carboxylesterase
MRAATGRQGASGIRAARILAAVCMSVGVLVGGAAAGSPAIAGPARDPAGWAAQCGAPALGLDQDTVQLAPVLASDTLPGGGQIVPRPLGNGTWVPVVMVHGWISQDTNNAARTGTFSHYIDLSDMPGFSPDVTRSLIGQLQRIPGAAVFTFDYHPYAARWVDDPHLGPALGKVIDCLYRASGQKVIIVAHSMGGLIARYAATHPGGTGRDRSGEISSVVTFGTPETGSVAALLAATGIDAGATVSDELAAIRLVLAACGQLASGDVKTGSLCDTLPAPARAFASDAGIALRAGSPQLAALKPWTSSIHVTALAGNATFELPDPGWFSLPWDTTSVDVGDMIVTRGSALAGATTTGNASCDYQLNLVRGATDQVSVWLGLAAKGQVAQQPLGSFAGACFHTNLMRGIELANDAYPAVAADIASRAPVTAQELLSAPVPASCEHAAGRLVNGLLPGIPANHGEMQLAWLNTSLLSKSAGTAFGDLNSDGMGDAATVLYCNAGGVSWPDVIAFYAQGQAGLKLLAWAYITNFNLPGIRGQENGFVRQIRYQEGAVYAEWSTQDNGDAAATSTLDYSATLRLSGGKIIATNLVGVTERQTVLRFANDLRVGNKTAADASAAPGVGEEAASLFRSYPSALNAAPTCYGLNDVFAMPTPLANLIDQGGSGQVNQDTERLCAFPSTDPGADWVALGMHRTGWRTWQVLWAQSA